MSALPAGTTVAYTKLIQRAINEKTGANLTVDGQFGSKSVAALCTYQNLCGLPITGVYDAATAAVCGPFIAGKYLTLSDYQQAAGELGTDVTTIQTVCSVETSGAGFFNDGSVAILFERYQFYRTLNTVLSAATVNQIVAANPLLCNTTPGGYQGGPAEHQRLRAAQAICTQYGVNPDLALRCASWGLFQIMGYYYIQCGYSNIEDFTNAMAVNEHNQLEGFVTYLKDMNDGAMLAALRTHQWVSFANQYNGKNQHAQNNYDGKLADAYQNLLAHPMF
jgi:hypothetical protein